MNEIKNKYAFIDRQKINSRINEVSTSSNKKKMELRWVQIAVVREKMAMKKGVTK